MTIAEIAPLRARPLTAAALNLGDGVASDDLKRQLKRHEAWQMDAAGYFSEIGEIHYVVNRAASALSEAHLYCATRDPETGQLIPADAPESGVPEAVAAEANRQLAELRSPVGGQQQLIHQAYVNTEIAGEWFLVDGTSEQNPDGGWWVRSVLETKIGEPNQPVVVKGIGNVPYDAVSRVWRPHPMRFEAADSGMRPVLGACELVILIDRHFRAAMRSRLFAGLLLLPNGLRQGNKDVSQRDDPKADKFIEDFIEALSEGIMEEGSASAVTPNFLWGSKEDLEPIRRVEFAQRVDPETMALRESSISRIIQGLEYPPEVVTGTGDASHWGAWFIGDDFVNHIRPKGDFLADAFTTVYLRPGLESNGIPPDFAEQVFLAFDYAPLARKPNIVETATLAHDRYVISDESLRRDLGYDDDDAPTPEEVAERVARKQAVRATSTGVMTGPPDGGPEAVTSAAKKPNTVGARLAKIDAELLNKLVGATLASMRRAAEKAGNKAKSKVAAAHRDALRDIPPRDVCAQLGPTLLAAANLDADELLAGALDQLERDYRAWATAAGLAAFAVAGAAEDDDAKRRLDDNVDRSWLWLAGALTAAMTTRLAAGGEPSEAEIRALLRQGLAMAGGVTELAPHAALGTIPATAATGIGTGPMALEMLNAAGYEVPGWRWVHDSPEHPFPPHEALDGAEAATIDEFGISFDGWPGDHQGCRCVLEPLVVRD